MKKKIQFAAPLPVLLFLPFDRKSAEWKSLTIKLRLELAVLGLDGFNRRYGVDFKSIDEFDKMLK